ncbi:MAG: HNH endonuclease [Myxococcaceae bacterium]|nr:HNH endonuclease [Myxococcaceae bacterium]
MRGYVATTDFSWFSFLRARQPLDEVNFWQPSAHGFSSPPGTPFFFKLKKPHFAIAGFGLFARYEEATPRLAWDAFKEKNGAASFDEMRARMEAYATSANESSHRVGCIMVSQPVFFAEGDWVEQPKDWKRNIVSGAGYDLTLGEGRRIWEECVARAARTSQLQVADGRAVLLPTEAAPRFGAELLVRPRLGQGTFRVAVTAAYDGACAVSGEHSLPALDAAHIRPYSVEGGSHEVTNGLLLRADIHRLFDSGYVTITPELRFVVSERLKKEWENGRAYYALQGQVALPRNAADRPDLEALRWHNEHVFERTAA